MLLRNAWYIGAWADELDDKPLARRICGDPVVLFRDGSGRAAALADRCCHRAAPLHLGSLVEAGIQCGYHGLRFRHDGTLRDDPRAKADPAERAGARPPRAVPRRARLCVSSQYPIKPGYLSQWIKLAPVG
jgi:phenylpropionate dioxygenase-like ring-hydroxylating dioxygenase large terminal subunit